MNDYPLIALVIGLLMPVANVAANPTTHGSEASNAAAMPAASLNSTEIHGASHSVRWQRLLHYDFNHDRTSAESQVDDGDFFLAADGRTQPEHELVATLNAFYHPLSDPDQHPVCRYPSRWNYLSTQFDLPPPPITPTQCPEFSQWLAAMNPNSASLVLASSYLNSPSSMFGHTFLRIDPANVERDSKWLSLALELP